MNLENLELEKAVLAAMITDVQQYFALSDRLQGEAFTSSLHKALYREIGKMANHDGRVSSKLLTHRLQSEFEDIGPYAGALVSMGRDSDEIAMAQDYAETLVDMHMRRAAQAAIEEARKNLSKIDQSPEAALIKLTESLADLTNLSSFGRRQSIQSVVGEVIDYAADTAKGEISGIGYPLEGLHRLAGETMPGEVVLIGGNPGGGKTALMMQCAMAMSQERSGLVAEMEMTNLNVVKRWVAGTANIPFQTVDRGKTTSDQFTHMNEILGSVEGLRLEMISGRLTVPELRARAMAVKKQRGLDHLWIDHIKKMPIHTKYRMSTHDVVYQNTEALSDLAKELGIAVFVLCHFTKSARQKDTPEPEMEDFYGGGIEEHADVMLATLNRHAWLQNHPPNVKTGAKMDEWRTGLMDSENKIEVYKLKHRRMEMTGVAKFHWDGARTLLSDIVPDQRDLLDEQPPF